MLTSAALGSRLLRWGASLLLTCSLAFCLLEVGLAVLSDGVPQAMAAKKKYGKKRIVRKQKSRRAASYPPLRDGYGVTALALQSAPTSPSPKLASGITPPPSRPIVSSSRPVTAPSHSAPPPAHPASPALTKNRGKVKPPPPTDSEILDDAQNAYVDGERQRAIDIALTVAEKNGATAEAAWRFIGLAACSVRSHRMATRAYQNLHAPGDQRSITSACKVNGLSYRDEQFVRE